MTQNVIDQVTGNSKRTGGFDNVTQQYGMEHKELDTSMRLADFENEIKLILEAQLEKENQKAVKQGKALSDVVQYNNFENDHQTKFYKEQMEDMIGNVNQMNVEELKVQKMRMEHLTKSLEDSDAQEKKFLMKQMEESQKFIEAELKKKDSFNTKIGDKMEEALDNYAQIEGLAMGLVNNNPLAGVAIKMAVAFYQRNRERKKNLKKQLEADEHKKQMDNHLFDQQESEQKRKEKRDEKFSKLQENEVAKESRFSRRRNDEIIKENEKNQEQSDENEYSKWKGDDVESSGELSKKSSENETLINSETSSENKDEPSENKAEEVREQQATKKERKVEQTYYNDTKKYQKVTLKLLKRIDKKTILIEKHTKKFLKKKMKGGGGMGMGGGMGGMGSMLSKAGPALAVAGAGAVGWMIGEGINSAVEGITGDSVGGNIYNMINGGEDPKNQSKEKQEKDKELRIDASDYAVGSARISQLEDAGIIDWDRIGTSEVEDWGKLEALNIYALKELYAYDDLNEEDTKRLEEIIKKKNAEWDVKVAEGKKRRAERNKKSIEEGTKATGKKSDEKVIKKDTSTKGQYTESYFANQSATSDLDSIKGEMTAENTQTVQVEDVFGGYENEVQFKDPKKQAEYKKAQKAQSSSKSDLDKKRNAYKIDQIKKDSKGGKYEYQKKGGGVFTKEEVDQGGFTDDISQVFAQKNKLNTSYDDQMFANTQDPRNNKASLTGKAEQGHKGLGGVSAKYETGGKGAGTISSGRGDPGGKSYGTYQLASKTGTLQKYLDQSKYKEQLGGEVNSQEFQDNWKKLAEENPEFGQDQHDFIKKTHYDPVMADFKKQSGMESLEDMPGLQDALWSQSVQHSGGGNSKIIKNALANVGEGATEEDYINALYGARGDYTDKIGARKGNAQVSGLSGGRYAKERLDALELAKTGRGEKPLEEPLEQLAQAEIGGKTEEQIAKSEQKIAKDETGSKLTTEMQQQLAKSQYGLKKDPTTGKMIPKTKEDHIKSEQMWANNKTKPKMAKTSNNVAINDPFQESLEKTADKYHDQDTASFMNVANAGTSSLDAKGGLVPNKPPSQKLTAQIDSTKSDIDKQKADKAQQPVMINNSVANNSSGGGGGGGGGSVAPTGARNTESTINAIVLGQLKGSMV